MNYLPFGFKYPVGADFSDQNPDPVMEAIRSRTAFLNEAHDTTDLPGHIFAAAAALMQSKSDLPVSLFWGKAMQNMTPADIGRACAALAPLVADEPARLEFPNAIALFDCRFVSTEEWEHARRYSIGGSEAAAVLGVSHYATARTLYLEKTTWPKKEKDISRDQMFAYGHAVEEYVVSRAANTLGAKICPEHRMFAHRDYPFLTCNPDGILVFPDGRYALFEAKTALRWKKADWKAEIPDYYVPQPRHYFEVMDDPKLESGYIACCFGGLPTDHLMHNYKRDRKAGADQVRALVEFWQNHYIPRIPPDFSGNPELDIEAAYRYIPHQEGKSVTDLPDICIYDMEYYFDLDSELATRKAECKELKQKESELLEEIKLMVPEGITFSSADKGLTYRIKISDYERTTVSSQQIPNALELLKGIQDNLRVPTLEYTIPKIKRHPIPVKGGATA